jgi:hypothetical protein
MRKITDLEKFALEHIIRPYQNEMPDRWTNYGKYKPGLEELAMMLKEDTEWSRMVLNRIRRIKFSFPSYVKHELVEIIKSR